MIRIIKEMEEPAGPTIEEDQISMETATEDQTAGAAQEREETHTIGLGRTQIGEIITKRFIRILETKNITIIEE